VLGTATGHLFYLKRQVNPLIGLGGKATALRLPARESELETIRQSDCKVIGTAVTAADGSFSISVPVGQKALIRAYARRNSADYQVRVLRNSSDLIGQNVTSPAVTMSDGLALSDLVANLDDPDRSGGAFNIFELILGAIDEVKTLNGGLTPPLLKVKWFSGNNASGTFFNPNGDSIQLIGGRAGLQDSTDTDEFDDAVILHEFGHFLVYHYSRDDNPGGYHGGEDLDPRLAYAEGLATFLSAMLRNHPDYVDTYGNADGGAGKFGLFLSENLEDFSQGLSPQFYKGIGSEESVEIVLWDLYDNTNVGEAFDNFSAGLSGMWSALAGMTGQSFTYIGDFADVLAGLFPADAAAIEDILAAEQIGPFTGFPPVPTDAADFFPARLDLAGPVTVTGSINSTYFYANGGTNLYNGIRSSDFYGFVLTKPGTLSAALTITGPSDGLPLGDQPHDLDLRLYDSSGTIIAASQSATSPIENIAISLTPGEYMLEVAGDFRYASFPIDNPYQGQVADYSLVTSFSPHKKQAPIPLKLKVEKLGPGIALLTLEAAAPLAADEARLELVLPPDARILGGSSRHSLRLKAHESSSLAVVVELPEAEWPSIAGRAVIRSGAKQFAREVYASTE
jgi:hypothetical protein